MIKLIKFILLLFFAGLALIFILIIGMDIRDNKIDKYSIIIFGSMCCVCVYAVVALAKSLRQNQQPSQNAAAVSTSPAMPQSGNAQENVAPDLILDFHDLSEAEYDSLVAVISQDIMAKDGDPISLAEITEKTKIAENRVKAAMPYAFYDAFNDVMTQKFYPEVGNKVDEYAVAWQAKEAWNKEIMEAIAAQIQKQIIIAKMYYLKYEPRTFINIMQGIGQ